MMLPWNGCHANPIFLWDGTANYYKLSQLRSDAVWKKKVWLEMRMMDLKEGEMQEIRGKISDLLTWLSRS